MNRTQRQSAAVTLLALAGTAQAALFDGSNPDVWVIDPVTGLMQGIDAGQWTEAYQTGMGPLYPLAGQQQALVNNLQASSLPMQPGQPSISVASFDTADAATGSPQSARALDVQPADGAFDQTIGVSLGVSPEVLANGAVTLRWTVRRSGLPDDNRALTLCQTGAAPAAGCRLAQPVAGGRAGTRFFLVQSDSYTVNASVDDDTGQTLDSQSRQYTLASTDPRGPRRDSDADGLPDLVEQAIGLDPLTGDLGVDGDGDGWTNFDEWLRGSDMNAEGDTPADTDKDGWSDVDEQWRSSRVDDPSPQIAPAADETPDSEAFIARVLAFKQRPAARSLYEPEYLPTGRLAPRFSGKFDAISAYTLGGDRYGHRAARLSDQAIADAGLRIDDGSNDPLAVEDTRRQAALDTALDNNNVPSLRVPAGEGVVLSARQLGNGRAHVYKRVLPPLVAPSVAEFAQDDFGWVDPQQWRSAYLQYLVPRLTAAPEVQIDWPGTHAAMALEAILSGEAALRDAAAPVLYSEAAARAPRPWLTDWRNALDARAEPETDGSDTTTGLPALLQRLPALLADAAPLAAIADFFDAQTEPAVMPAGQFSDAWVARRLQQSFALDELGCFIPASALAELRQNPDDFAQFQADCPEFYTEEDLTRLRAEDQARRHALRVAMLASSDRLANDATLLDPAADSDGDFLSNREEIGFEPLPDLRLPWLADSDGDGLADPDDTCPVDPINGCLGFDQAPLLLADMAVQVTERAGGTVALVALYLDRASDTEVLARIRVSMGDGTASDGTDFEAFEAVITLSAGERVALVEIPILDDDDAEALETLQLELLGVAGARSGIPDDRVLVAIADDEVAIDPPVARIDAPARIDERAMATLDGGQSTDNAGDGLQFAWVQVDGPAVELRDTDQAQAILNAPATGMDLTVRLRLTVTDSGEQMDSAEQSITITAIEEPPVVVNSPRYMVTLGDRLTVDNATLFSNVNEPDGQPLSLDAVATPPERGNLQLLADGIRYDAPDPAGGEMALNTNSARELVRVGPDHAAFIQLGQSFGDPVSLILFDSRSGTTDTLYTTNDSISDLVATPDRAVLYFNNGLNGDVFQWTPAAGVRQVPGLARPSLFSAILDAGNGSLYTCNGGGNWQRIDEATASSSDAGAACFDSSFGLLSAQRDQGVCIIEQGVLNCARPDGQLETLHDFGDEPNAMLARGNELLVFILSFNSSLYELHQVTAAGQASLLQTLPQDDGQLVPSGVQMDDGSLVFTRKDGDTARLMQWQGVAAGPASNLTAQQAPYSPRYALGDLKTDGTDLVWMFLSDDNEFTVAEVRGPSSASPGRFTPLSIFASDAFSTPSRLALDDGGPVFVRGVGEEGNCDLVQAGGGGFVSTLQSDIDCFNWEVFGPVQVYARNGENFTRTYFSDGAGGGTPGQVRFGLRISDTAGNAVELPVTVDLQAP